MRIKRGMLRLQPEMKSISITRLKRVRIWGRGSVHGPEMKSISITRLKRDTRNPRRSKRLAWNEKHLDYEIETTEQRIFGKGYSTLKWKASRLRDWNIYLTSACCRTRFPWNEKHLDYEIETLVICNIGLIRFKPEMKSISITRLKHPVTTPLIPLRWAWNEKHLDYEIETRILRYMHELCRNLKWKASRLRDWNITDTLVGLRQLPHLKWKASRLRDWNAWRERSLKYALHLKWKASRLRDWN